MRDGQFCTAFRNDVARLWCNQCEKSTIVDDHRATDELMNQHRCGPPDSSWDSADALPEH